MQSLYPFIFQPLFKEKVWGGQKIREILGMDFSPLPNCGEAWLLSGVEGNNTFLKNGFLGGNELNELVEIYMDELVGESVYERFGNEFPILVKIIDARQWLSIQVHPGDELARARGLSGGKTEMWYIMDADPGAELIAGFRRNTNPAEYQLLLQEKRLMEILNVEKVSKGDVFYMPSGRIHALGPGTLLAEIQQTSDTTYRIYDWDRTGENGTPRELHLKEALDAIDYNSYTDYRTGYHPEPGKTTHLLATPYFSTNLMTLSTAIEKDYSYIDSFVILLPAEGRIEVQTPQGTYPLKAGEAMLLPAISEKVTLNPLVNSVILETYMDLP